MLMKWAIYIVSVWISVKYADRYTVVGPVFGLAVVAYDSKFFRNVSRDKHVMFVAASTFIYALVYWVSLGKWESKSQLFNYFIGPFSVGVVLGSILLPLAHQIILRSSIAKTKQVIPSLVVSFYVVMLTAYLSNEFGFGAHFNFASVAIAVWQGLYLYLFFR